MFTKIKKKKSLIKFEGTNFKTHLYLQEHTSINLSTSKPLPFFYQENQMNA